MTRRKSRESAFQMVFGMAVSGSSAEEALLLAEETGDPPADEFSRQLVRAAFENREKIDRMITPHLKDWSLSRISRAALAVLRVSCAQLLLFPDISESVVINEAVEISKAYGADDDYSFVNGVLGSIVRKEPGGNESA